MYIDFRKGKNVAHLNRKKEKVEFCFNWCKRLKHCGLSFDDFTTGTSSCRLCEMKHHVKKPVKIIGIDSGAFILAPATKEEVQQMLFLMPKVGK